MRKFRVLRNLFLLYRNWEIMKFSFAILRNSRNTSKTSLTFLGGLGDSELEALEFLDRMYLMLKSPVAENKESFRKAKEIKKTFLKVYAEQVLEDKEK